MIRLRPLKQTTSQCGPTCLKMVFDYYGKVIGIDRISKVAKTSLRHGTSNENIVLAARNFGFNAEYIEEASIKELHNFVVDKKIPVIINWFNYTDKHYSVVVGLDERNIYFIDPDEGYRKKMSLKVFKKLWFDFSGDYLRSKKSLRLRPIVVISPKKSKK